LTHASARRGSHTYDFNDAWVHPRPIGRSLVPSE
jgi:hypothetical protein